MEELPESDCAESLPSCESPPEDDDSERCVESLPGDTESLPRITIVKWQARTVDTDHMDGTRHCQRSASTEQNGRMAPLQWLGAFGSAAM